MITSPEQFQSTALAWIGVATVVLGALAGFVALVVAKIAQIKADLAAKQGATDHAMSTSNIAALQTAVTDIALKTPSPTNGAPMPVTVTNPVSDPANVAEVPTKK